MSFTESSAAARRRRAGGAGAAAARGAARGRRRGTGVHERRRRYTSKLHHQHYYQRRVTKVGSPPATAAAPPAVWRAARRVLRVSWNAGCVDDDPSLPPDSGWRSTSPNPRRASATAGLAAAPAAAAVASGVACAVVSLAMRAVVVRAKSGAIRGPAVCCGLRLRLRQRMASATAATATAVVAASNCVTLPRRCRRPRAWVQTLIWTPMAAHQEPVPALSWAWTAAALATREAAAPPPCTPPPLRSPDTTGRGTRRVVPISRASRGTKSAVPRLVGASRDYRRRRRRCRRCRRCRLDGSAPAPNATPLIFWADTHPPQNWCRLSLTSKFCDIFGPW